MLRLLSTIRKELLILSRDKGGLAIMFLMPMVMITIMALIQDAPFRDYQEIKIPLLLVNNDTGSLGKQIEEGLQGSKLVEITKATLTENEVTQKIKASDYEIGIIIPNNATELLNKNVNTFVAKKLNETGLADSSKQPSNAAEQKLNLQILFAPGTKRSFKTSVLNSLKQSTSKLETQTLLDLFSKKLNPETAGENKQEPINDFVNVSEINTVDTPQEALLLNSVQHNVPAWTVFGMFFIVISMAGSIIKERDDGSYTRILTMPGSYATVLTGKITAYLFICLLQCLLMLLVGIYVLPHLGLPRMVIGSNISAIFIVAMCIGLAATGYGILVGTLFNTHQQASTFGAVSIVILAALGGIWVPVYVMPESIRLFATCSPLYWSLHAFHTLFLNAGTIKSILPDVLKLLTFFVFTISIALVYNRNKTKH
jgi:ABC-2 type transport system permease protein